MAINIARKPIAILFGIMIVFFPLAHANAGADYNNALTVPLIFLSIALMLAAITRDSLLLSAAFGTAIGSAVHTNPLILLIGPAIAILGLAFAHSKGRLSKRVLLYLASATAGILIINATYAAIYASFGRNWLFFMPQVELLLWNWRLKSGVENPWWVAPNWSWIRESTANAFMLSMFLVSVVEIGLITVQQKARHDLVGLSIYAGYAIVYLVALALQIKGLTPLNPDYLGVPFNVAALLPLLAVIERRAESPARLIVLAAPVFFIIALVSSSWHPVSIAPFWIVLLGIGTFYVATAAPLSGLVTPLLLIGVNTTLVASPDLYRYDPCHALRHLNTMMFSASKVAEQTVARPDTLRIWFDRAETLKAPCFNGVRILDIGGSFASIAHTYLGAAYGETNLNAITREDFERVTAEGGAIALITTGHKTAFSEKARSVGYALNILAMYYDRRTQVRFYFLSPATSPS
jgi:hypothetical protein